MSPLVRPVLRHFTVPSLVAGWLLAGGLAVAGPAPPRALRARLSKPVRIEAGSVAGVLSADGLVAVFRGIPYAAAPVGNLRWKAPQPPSHWSGVRSGAEFGAACPQADRPGVTSDRNAKFSEDCLYLNVWAPTRPPARHVPVLVWFHGGAFSHGTASTSAYDGEALARRGAVVVTFNYRLGPFGFFAHPLLTKESGHDASGNYGLLDQLAVLKWVKSNIRAFGGNPDRVTVFGQAAGAVCISSLLVSPSAKGLIHGAILQSGTALSVPRVGVTRFLNDAPAGEESMEDVGALITRRLGCDHEDDVLAALRARTTDEVMTAARPAPNFFGEGLRLGPVVDRWLIPDRPSVLFEQGKQLKVPLIVGANAEEGAYFATALQPWSVDSFRRFVRTTFRDRADDVLARYPVARDADARQAAARVITGGAFIAPARRTARAMADLGAKTYLYWFTRPRAGGGVRPASHGVEVPYLFDPGARASDAEASDREMALLLIGYWVRFAATGDPNGDNAPAWPRYATSTDQSLEFGDVVQSRGGVYHDTAEFFDRLSAERATRGTAGRGRR
jgi:para-nitrobenzyl esterase